MLNLLRIVQRIKIEHNKIIIYFYYIMEYDKNKHKYQYRYNYIKIWFVSILIFSIFVLLYQIVLNNSKNPFSYDDIYEYKLMQKNTPSYPPPLFNFLDS
jgi:hypothetical protein